MSTGLRAGTNNDGYLQVNGTDVLTALSSGNIGIGTDNPSSKLQLYSAGPQIQWTDSDNDSDGRIRYNGSLFIFETDSFNEIADSAFSFRVDGTNIADEKLRITSTGNVGIGTTNPGTKLDIQGGEVYYHSGTSNNLGIKLTYSNGNSTGIIDTYSNHDLEIRVNNSEKLRITSTGNVGIGTTDPDGQLTIRKQILVSDTISNTVSHLSLVSDGGGSNPHQSVIHFGPRNASTNSSPAAIAAIASGNTASDLAFYVNSNNNYSSTPNTEVLRISNSGNVGINTYPGDSLDILGGFRVQGNIRTRKY
jgi:hypothetical protein